MRCVPSKGIVSRFAGTQASVFEIIRKITYIVVNLSCLMNKISLASFIYPSYIASISTALVPNMSADKVFPHVGCDTVRPLCSSFTLVL